MDDRFDDPFIHFIKTVPVDFEHGESAVGDLLGDFFIGLNLSVITNPTEQVVGDARGSTGAFGDFESSGSIHIHIN